MGINGFIALLLYLLASTLFLRTTAGGETVLWKVLADSVLQGDRLNLQRCLICGMTLPAETETTKRKCSRCFADDLTGFAGGFTTASGFIRSEIPERKGNPRDASNDLGLEKLRAGNWPARQLGVPPQRRRAPKKPSCPRQAPVASPARSTASQKVVGGTSKGLRGGVHLGLRWTWFIRVHRESLVVQTFHLWERLSGSDNIW